VNLVLSRNNIELCEGRDKKAFAMPNITRCKAMTDYFEGIDKLVPEAPHTEGAPNFRRVSKGATITCAWCSPSLPSCPKFFAEKKLRIFCLLQKLLFL